MSDRHRLPDRRQGEALELTYREGQADEVIFDATFNGPDGGQVKEVFCMHFKEGSMAKDLLHHACIIISVALQSGSTMADLAHTLGEDKSEEVPKSILGLIVRTGAAIDAQRALERAQIPETAE